MAALRRTTAAAVRLRVGKPPKRGEECMVRKGMAKQEDRPRLAEPRWLARVHPFGGRPRREHYRGFRREEAPVSAG